MSQAPKTAPIARVIAGMKEAGIVDPREFIRFFISGVVAAGGNLVAVWAALHFVPYHFALLAGIAAGASISFPLAKFFAFKSTDWRDSRQEMGRFIIIYGAGVAVYWTVSMIFGRYILPHYLPVTQAGLLGAFIGASSTIISNYLGHRFYTYRSAHPRPAKAPSPVER